MMAQFDRRDVNAPGRGSSGLDRPDHGAGAHENPAAACLGPGRALQVADPGSEDRNGAFGTSCGSDRSTLPGSFGPLGQKHGGSMSNDELTTWVSHGPAGLACESGRRAVDR
jgi:hypothetical protein